MGLGFIAEFTEGSEVNLNGSRACRACVIVTSTILDLATLLLGIAIELTLSLAECRISPLNSGCYLRFSCLSLLSVSFLRVVLTTWLTADGL